MLSHNSLWSKRLALCFHQAPPARKDVVHQATYMQDYNQDVKT
jgi:hypothetical protein